MANVPGDQKLAPLSSADDEPWPKRVAKAIAETRISFGERLCATGRHPLTVHGMLLWDYPFE